MARRTSFVDAAKGREKATYFNSEYGFTKKTNMGLGVEAYFIFLGLENGVYQTPKHTVKSRKKGTPQESGFKGKYDKAILCKGVDEDGNKVEGAVCCAMAQYEKDRLPDKDDSAKRMISFTGTTVHVPVLILGNSEKDPKEKKIPPTKLSLNNYDFSYLELSQSTFQDTFVAGLATELKNAGTIDYDLEGEELNEAIMNQLQKTIIKVTGVASDKGFKYERKYSFIPFSMQAIGKATNEYEAITEYTSNKSVMNDAVDFMTLFETKVDELVLADYSDDELTKYIQEGTVRAENVEACVEAMSKEEEVVEFTEDEITTLEETAIVDEDLESLLTEEDFSLDTDDDLFDDED